MNSTNLSIHTEGDLFYDITFKVQEKAEELVSASAKESGLLHLFLKHTSCALTINEAYDPKACEDMQNFLRHLAPDNLSFIKHKDEGPDDSPSHMKAIITGHSLSIPVISGQLQLGTWQGIYLCEFRRSPKQRNVLISYH